MIKVTEIKYDMEVEFIARPNRYLAEVKINGEIELAHVHDPGRLKELLYPGNRVLIKKADNPNRKTGWDVVAAMAEDEVVIVNSAYHRTISEKIIRDSSINPLGEFENVKAEVKYGNSRIDYLAMQNGVKVWIEVKGCTLVKNKVELDSVGVLQQNLADLPLNLSDNRISSASPSHLQLEEVGDLDGMSRDKVATFPDAPTERGARHLEELTEIVKSGERAAVYILVLRAADEFEPNIETDKKFYENFYKALEAGVKIFPIQLKYRDGVVCYEKLLKIRAKIRQSDIS